jgi:hypothetical protein
MVSPPTPLLEPLLAALALLLEPLLLLLPLLPLLPLRNAYGLVELVEPTPLVLMIHFYLSSDGLRNGLRNRLRTQLCPNFNVASIMSREVLSTSTSFW